MTPVFSLSNSQMSYCEAMVDVNVIYGQIIVWPSVLRRLALPERQLVWRKQINQLSPNEDTLVTLVRSLLNSSPHHPVLLSSTTTVELQISPSCHHFDLIVEYANHVWCCAKSNSSHLLLQPLRKPFVEDSSVTASARHASKISHVTPTSRRPGRAGHFVITDFSLS